MATEFNWSVVNMERTTADGIVFVVHWHLTGTSDDGVYSASAYGSIGLEQPDPENVIPYSELTPELVLQWTQDKLGEETVAATLAAIENQIEEQRNPTKAVGVPW